MRFRTELQKGGSRKVDNICNKIWPALESAASLASCAISQSGTRVIDSAYTAVGRVNWAFSEGLLVLEKGGEPSVFACKTAL